MSQKYNLNSLIFFFKLGFFICNLLITLLTSISFIKKVIEQHSDEIVRIITIDAGIKFEGDKTGEVVSGVGAAIGGFGVEKSKIEDISTKTQIPLDALICRQSLEDAICTMKKPILDSVPIIIEKTKTIIRRNTKENQSIIIAGIGNTMGIGI